MIVFAAFTPHTPLLIPTIGKENGEKLSETAAAMNTLAEELYATHPDTIVVLSGHSAQHETAFSLNLHDEYWADLKSFGDMGTTKEFQPDLALMDRIQRTVRKEQLPLTLDSDGILDHGSSIPLLLLTKELKNVSIVPISYSGLSAKEHVAFGRVLKDILINSPKRIAVIASGDLSHCLSEEAPDGFRKEGEWFDTAIKSAIEHVGTSKLLAMDPELIQAASECGYHPLLMLFGIIERMQVTSDILSYEAPFGVGFLVAQFHMH